MVNPLYTSEKLPSTSLEALRAFDERYIAALSVAQPDTWADEFGDFITTEAPMTTFPITQLATKYRQYQGEQRFKQLIETGFSIKAQEYQAGYEAKFYDLSKNVYAWRQWSQAPGRFVTAEGRHRVKAIMALLEAGASTTGYPDGGNFFRTNHPVNLFDSLLGTFSNYDAGGTSVLSVANIQAQVVQMKLNCKDENGDRMTCNPDTIAVPYELGEPLKNLLAKEYIEVGSNGAMEPNPYKGRFRIIELADATDVNDWYLLDSQICKELPPWISLRETVSTALALRQFDESSDFFKNTGRIKVSSHIWYGFSLAFPHGIRKIVGA